MVKASSLQWHRAITSNQVGFEHETSVLCELHQLSQAYCDIPAALSRTQKEQTSVQLCSCEAFLPLAFVQPARLPDDCCNWPIMHTLHLPSVLKHQPLPYLHTIKAIISACTLLGTQLFTLIQKRLICYFSITIMGLSDAYQCNGNKITYIWRICTFSTNMVDYS